MPWDAASFKEKIEKEHSFPGTYLFKFIVPKANAQQVLDILPEGTLTLRDSSSAHYTSVTLYAPIASSDEVIAVYLQAYQINGIIAL